MDVRSRKLTRIIVAAVLLVYTLESTTQPYNCGRTPSEHFFLDQTALGTPGQPNYNSFGDFPFCLPGTRTWLRHAFRPCLQGLQVWKLLVRSSSFEIFGRAFFTLDQQWNRLTCHNGTTLQGRWGGIHAPILPPGPRTWTLGGPHRFFLHRTLDLWVLLQ